ncbi:MAG TPA: hypothetical protein VL651_00195 [Bacteroidia bacterium]|jgi:hypothetical protein|nr:hypothetical protein [Bacteroidia bacterium]
MRKIIGVLLICISLSAHAQVSGFLNGPGGQFSLGVRTTASFFNDESGTGIGYGGQFRLRFFKLLSSDWFADYIQSDIKGLGKRTDYHIGWAVIFYPPFMYRNNQLHKIQPYLLAGHCFDYTKFTSNYSAFYTPAFVDADGVAEDHRWSAAVSYGIGFHLPMTDKIDISMNALYMNHLGKQITATVEHDQSRGQDYLFFSTNDSPSKLDGHLLVSFSLNYRLADLWKKTIRTRHQSDQMQDQNQPNPF